MAHICGYCQATLTDADRIPGPDSHVSKCQAKWQAAQDALPARYTDAWLDMAEAGDFGRGDRNAAGSLRKLNTVERRQRAVNEAHTLSNVRGGIYSQNVSSAVHALLKAIESGTEDDRLYGEGFAHNARENEKRLREATGDANAIYYPKFPVRN